MFNNLNSLAAELQASQDAFIETRNRLSLTIDRAREETAQVEDALTSSRRQLEQAKEELETARREIETLRQENARLREGLDKALQADAYWQEAMVLIRPLRQETVNENRVEHAPEHEERAMPPPPPRRTIWQALLGSGEDSSRSSKRQDTVGSQVRGMTAESEDSSDAFVPSSRSHSEHDTDRGSSAALSTVEHKQATGGKTHARITTTIANRMTEQVEEPTPIVNHQAPILHQATGPFSSWPVNFLLPGWPINVYSPAEGRPRLISRILGAEVGRVIITMLQNQIRDRDLQKWAKGTRNECLMSYFVTKNPTPWIPGKSWKRSCGRCARLRRLCVVLPKNCDGVIILPISSAEDGMADSHDPDPNQVGFWVHDKATSLEI
jgi:regulator of replication initiation timing